MQLELSTSRPYRSLQVVVSEVIAGCGEFTTAAPAETTSNQDLLDRLAVERSFASLPVNECTSEQLSPLFNCLQTLMGQEVAAIEDI